MVTRRMYGQHLWGSPLDSVDEVIRAFGAIQAQEFLPAEWSIAARLSDADETDVRAAYRSGSLLRTHILRPTWHFVHSADIRWMLLATARRVHAVNGYYYRATGVDEQVGARARAVFETALGDGQHLTRRELAELLAAAGLPSSGNGLAYVVIRAELDGVLVSGAMRGKQHTYALLDLRSPGPAATDRDEALAELARRYFSARGPATIKDYCVWASLTVADAKRGIDILGDELQVEDVEGRTYRSVAGTVPGRRRRKPVIDLLQDYDEYVVGYSQSRDLILRPDGPQSALGARIRPMLLDGYLFGHWKHAVTKGGDVVVEARPSRPFTAAESAAMDAAVARFGRFLRAATAWTGLPAS
ncbi:MAG TPA: winged helix DNA-binding domain-containing protein [Micromonosporaceae bacterium]|jgi:hypothetical protein